MILNYDRKKAIYLLILFYTLRTVLKQQEK